MKPLENPLHENPLQALQDLQGFVVVGYIDRPELQIDDGRGHIGSDCEGWLYGIDPPPRIIGPATTEEWEGQCSLLNEDANDAPYIGFRKVRAE